MLGLTTTNLPPWGILRAGLRIFLAIWQHAHHSFCLCSLPLEVVPMQQYRMDLTQCEIEDVVFWFRWPCGVSRFLIVSMTDLEINLSLIS